MANESIISKAVRQGILLSTFGGIALLGSAIAAEDDTQGQIAEQEQSLVAAASGSASVADENPEQDESTEESESTEEDESTAVVDEKVERISVTGSRISRADMEGPSQLVVITEEDMKAQGFITVFDALKGVTQNTGVVQGNEAGAMGGFTGAADVINLRGFGPGYTLVLVNGRRVAESPMPYGGNSNFVNMNGIPSAAVKRTEILADGASAIYGSDAVAGVVNIILKDDVDYTSITGQLGGTREGGGERGRFQLVSGTYGDRYSITGGVEYSNQQPIFGHDRDSMDSVFDKPGGSGNLSLNIGDYSVESENGSFVNRGTRTTAEDCASTESGYIYAEREGSGGKIEQYCGTDSIGDTTIQNERENFGLFSSFNYDLTDNTQLYIDLMYANMNSATLSGKHTVGDYFFVASDPRYGAGNLAWYADQTGDNRARHLDYVIQQRTFTEAELGGNNSEFNEWTVSSTLGLNGYLNNGYEWGSYYTESRADYLAEHDKLLKSEVERYFYGRQSTSFHRDMNMYDGMGELGGVYGVVTEQMRQDLRGTASDIGDSYSRTLAADLAGYIWELPYGDLQFAAIGEFNRQGYDVRVDDKTRNQEWHNWAGTEGGGSRDRYAAGGELLVPLYRGLELNLAGRYDHYDDNTSDIGGRFSPSAKIAYRPVRSVLLRAGYNEGFRAPDMHYVFADESTFYGGSVMDYTSCADQLGYDYIVDPENAGACSGFTQFNMQGTRSGSTELKEEESTSYTLGLVAEPFDGFSFTLDWFEIELRNVVGDESLSAVINAEFYCKHHPEVKDDERYVEYCAFIDDKITRSEGDSIGFGGTIESIDISPVNRAMSSQSGLDASVGYYMDSPYGGFNFSSSWTHILSTKRQSSESAPEQDYRDDPSNFEARSRMNFSLTHMYDRYSATVRLDRTGSVPLMSQPLENYDVDENGMITGLNKVSRTDAYYKVNFNINYLFNNGLHGSLSVNNLFDSMPDDDTATNWPFYNYSAHPGAAVGTQFFADVSYRF